MLEAERQWLPQFAGKAAEADPPTISIPPNVKRRTCRSTRRWRSRNRFGEAGGAKARLAMASEVEGRLVRGIRNIMTSDKVRIGFVGVGGMGQCAHLQELRHPARLRGGGDRRDPRRTSRRRCRRAVRHPRASTPTTPRCWRKEKLDGIVASQPFTRHGIAAARAAARPACRSSPRSRSPAPIEMGEKILAALRGQRHLAHGRLPQAQRPGHDVRQGGDRPAESHRANWAS